MSLREDILAINDGKVEEFFVPEWDKTIHLRVLAGAERVRLVTGSAETYLMRFVAMVVCDERGARVFTDNDALKLGEKSGLALQRILQAGTLLNKLDVEAIDDAEKKSAPTPTGGSGTVSP